MSDGCAKVVNNSAEKTELLCTSVVRMKLNITNDHIAINKSIVLQQ